MKAFMSCPSPYLIFVKHNFENGKWLFKYAWLLNTFAKTSVVNAVSNDEFEFML